MSKLKPISHLSMTKREKEFVAAHQQCGGVQEDIAQMLNISVTTVLSYLNKPRVKAALDNNNARVREYLNASAMYQLRKLEELANDENTPAGIRAGIRQDLLDRAGFSQPKAPQVQVNINTEIADRARLIFAERLSASGSTTIDVETEQLP